MMFHKRGLLASAAALLVVIIVVGYATSISTPVKASTTAISCLFVNHVYPPTTAENPSAYVEDVATSGVDGSTYDVQYRLHVIGTTDTWSSWSTPTETSSASDGVGTYAYKYTTGTHNDSTYDYVEWQVTTSGHSGTDTTSLASVTSDEPDASATYTELDPGTCGASINDNPNQIDWLMLTYR